MLIDYNFTSCGHLQQRLAVSLGALFFCVLWKKCVALCYHRASTVSYLIKITHPSDHTPEIEKYQNTDIVSLQTSILSLYLFLYFWLIALLAIALTLVYMERDFFFFQKQESLGIMQHILYRCSCFSEPITSIFVFCSPFALFQDY